MCVCGWVGACVRACVRVCDPFQSLLTKHKRKMPRRFPTHTEAAIFIRSLSVRRNNNTLLLLQRPNHFSRRPQNLFQFARERRGFINMQTNLPGPVPPLPRASPPLSFHAPLTARAAALTKARGGRGDSRWQRSLRGPLPVIYDECLLF